MQVYLKGFTDTDAIIVIECECGNTHMLDEAGDFAAEQIYVCRYGVPAKTLRCSRKYDLTSGIRSSLPDCRERYRITLRREYEPPYLIIEHITSRPNEQILEAETITFARPST